MKGVTSPVSQITDGQHFSRYYRFLKPTFPKLLAGDIAMSYLIIYDIKQLDNATRLRVSRAPNIFST
ncbi:MAG: hypothetical protein ABH852_04855, partial [Methanobacteriota archaeon]